MSPHPWRRAPDEPLQLSLLQGFPASAAAAAGPALAARLPVARVRLESSLPHLDRPFDYSVPAALDAAAQPGVRVKVKFNGQELAGYLMERVAESDAGHPLVPLHKVVSPVPVLTPAVAELAGTCRRALRRQRQRRAARRRAAADGETGEGPRP